MQSESNVIDAKPKTGYLQIIHQKEYMKLICANVINRFGDSIDAIAFTWLVYGLTNSAAWSAVIFGVNKVPTIFLQPFAGPMVEHMNKKRIMVLTDIIRGLCVSLVAIMFLLKLLNPWWLLGITLIISSAEAFRGPAGSAILPRILDKNCYDYGISLNSSLCSIVELIGFASAGVIIGLLGIHTAILIDAVTFFGSALIISFMHSREEKNDFKELNLTEYFASLKGGIDYIRNNEIIFNFVLLAMVANAILVPLNSLEAPLIKNILHQGEYLLSDLSFSLSAGLCLGSVAYPFISKKLKTRNIVFLSGFIISVYYFILVLCGHISSNVILLYVICTISSAAVGAILALLMAVLQVQFMKRVEADYLARASSIVGAGSVGSIPVVSFLVGILSKMISVTAIFYVVGLLGLLFFLFVYVKNVKFE
jgi:MFS family permease